MSTNNFVKSACRQCGGHLEFPAAAAGETIACPHCGQPTELAAPVLANRVSDSRRKKLALVAVVLVLLIGLAAVLNLRRKFDRGVISEKNSAPVALAKTSAIPVVSSVLPAKLTAEQRTNDFAISAVKLEKTPGSSLVYVTGKIRNLSRRQRFGVKVEFGLFDTNDTAVGKATDYQPILEPDGDWHFKALVMESKTASARVNAIAEDRQ
jgi:uncharacterized OB-fold protein